MQEVRNSKLSEKQQNSVLDAFIRNNMNMLDFEQCVMNYDLSWRKVARAMRITESACLRYYKSLSKQERAALVYDGTSSEDSDL